MRRVIGRSSNASDEKEIVKAVPGGGPKMVDKKTNFGENSK